MALKTCPHCGHNVSDQAIKCPSCGKDPRYTDFQLEQREQQHKKKRRAAGIIITIVVVIIATVCAYLSPEQDSLSKGNCLPRCQATTKLQLMFLILLAALQRFRPNGTIIHEGLHLRPPNQQ